MLNLKPIFVFSKPAYVYVYILHLILYKYHLTASIWEHFLLLFVMNI